MSDIRVTLLQSGKTLLNQFESSLQNVALKNFSGRVDVVFGARVTKVTDRLVYLQNGDEIPYGILVWAAGNATRDIVSHLIQKLPPSESGKPYRKLPVDPWLRVKGLDNIFAMGDCAIIEDGALPSTAQVAGQQGAYLGRKLGAVLSQSCHAMFYHHCVVLTNVSDFVPWPISSSMILQDSCQKRTPQLSLTITDPSFATPRTESSTHFDSYHWELWHIWAMTEHVCSDAPPMIQFPQLRCRRTFSDWKFTFFFFFFVTIIITDNFVFHFFSFRNLLRFSQSFRWKQRRPQTSKSQAVLHIYCGAACTR